MFARWMELQGRRPSTIGRRLSTLSSFHKYCQIEDIIDKNPALNVRRPRAHDESRTLGLDRNELGALLVQAGLGDSREGALITLLALNGLRISEALNANITDFSMERTTGPIFLGLEGGRMDRYCADRMVKRPQAIPIRERQCATTGHAGASTDTPPTSCPRSSPEPHDQPDIAPLLRAMDAGQLGCFATYQRVGQAILTPHWQRDDAPRSTGEFGCPGPAQRRRWASP
jgi:integrase